MRPAWAAFSLTFLVCALDSAFAEPIPAGGLRTVHIKLERGQCFGTCPAYSVEIDGDGKVEYHGDEFVLAKGHRTQTISLAAVASLLDKFRAADFWSLRPQYVARMTDNSHYRVTLTIGGQTKSVIDYVGREVGMPASVTELEDEIDRVAETAQRIGHRPETRQ